MGEDKNKDADKESEVDPRDSDKEYYVCGVCSPVCSAIFIAILLICELGFLIYELVAIENNTFFDNNFGLIYFIFLIPLLFSIMVFVVFFFNYKSQSTRGWIPEGLLVAALANFALVVWILIYISFFYEYRSVAVERKLNLGPKFEALDNNLENGANTEASQALDKL
jgi:hypothetical protein